MFFLTYRKYKIGKLSFVTMFSPTFYVISPTFYAITPTNNIINKNVIVICLKFEKKLLLQKNQ